jgi:hypothetical protein
MKRIALLIDAIINMILGVLLIFFPFVSKYLGVPPSDTSFYPNILGGVFIGITFALLIEAFRKEKYVHIGLGLIGAICINICGGIVLILWLLFGELTLPIHGVIFLWTLAIILLIISSLELILILLKVKNDA